MYDLGGKCGKYTMHSVSGNTLNFSKYPIRKRSFSTLICLLGSVRHGMLISRRCSWPDFRKAKMPFRPHAAGQIGL